MPGGAGGGYSGSYDGAEDYGAADYGDEHADGYGSAPEDGLAGGSGSAPWWEQDDKEYDQILDRLKKLDIPLPPQATGSGGGNSRRPASAPRERSSMPDKQTLYTWDGPANDAPWGERREQTRPMMRPRSAPRVRASTGQLDAARRGVAGYDADGSVWTGRPTVPKPFKFDRRPKHSSIMAERTMYDVEVQRRLEESELATRFRAEPVPHTTTLPLYEQKEARAEAVRQTRIAKRFQELQQQSNPPNCYYMRPKDPPTIAKPPAFKAKPVPVATKRSKMQSFEVERLMRQERVAQRSKLLLESAALPSRQEQHQREQREQREREAADPRAKARSRAARRAHERKIGVTHPTFRPKLTKKDIASVLCTILHLHMLRTPLASVNPNPTNMMAAAAAAIGWCWVPGSTPKRALVWQR